MPGEGREGHWSTISLGIVTIATAAIGGALFAIDLGKIVTSLPTYFLIALAIAIYLQVLSVGERAIFSTEAELTRHGTSKRRVARILYRWFFVELFAIAGLLISQANASLLQLLALAQSH